MLSHDSDWAISTHWMPLWSNLAYVPSKIKTPLRFARYRPVEMWWHTHRNQILSFRETDESISIGGGRQFSRLLAAEVWASAVVTLDTPCSEVVWRLLATHSILQFPLHFPFHASPCAITFQLDYTLSHLVNIRNVIQLQAVRGQVERPCTVTPRDLNYLSPGV